MNVNQRAEQIWPILALCARFRATVSYEILGRLIGVPRQGLGQLLEPIQSYCIINHLPPLSVLVVTDKSGLPGEGFIAAGDVPHAQAQVFAQNWLKSMPPSAADLAAAVSRLPSNGRALSELVESLGKE